MGTYIEREYLERLKNLSPEEKEHLQKDGDYIDERFTFFYVASLFAGTDHGEKFEDYLIALKALPITSDFLYDLSHMLPQVKYVKLRRDYERGYLDYFYDDDLA